MQSSMQWGKSRCTARLLAALEFKIRMMNARFKSRYCFVGSI
jgi:hypothetical protein